MSTTVQLVTESKSGELIVEQLSQASTASKGKYIPINLPKPIAGSPHNIKAVIQHIFVVPEGNVAQKENRYYIRSGIEKGAIHCLNSKASSCFSNGTYVAYFPAGLWDEAKTTYDMRQRFILISQKTDEYSTWYNYSPDKLIYVEYEIVETLGCKHYVHGCEFKCDECQDDEQYHVCKRCHYEAMSTQLGMDDNEHENLVSADKTVRCMYCKNVQKIGLKCLKCDAEFGNYLCEECDIVAFVSDSNPVSHCTKCRKCYSGSQELYKHCDGCSMCYYINTYRNHKSNCSGSVPIQDCIICGEGLQTSNMPYGSLPCGRNHNIHMHCYQNILNENIDKCPVCDKCIITKDSVLRDSIKFY